MRPATVASPAAGSAASGGGRERALDVARGTAHDDLRAGEPVHELHVADDVLHRGLEDVAAQREPRRRHDEGAADVGQRPPAAHDAEAHDVLAGVEELAQRGGAQGGRVAAAQRREQGAVAGDAPDRRVADGAVGLLLVDPPGYAAERVGAYGGGGRLGSGPDPPPARRRSPEVPRPRPPGR